ncbi:MAG: helix-turn-helix transcriptional regulator [Candidatus Schekmanbacteria bacterium]|nr:helix-turn-helix transcriptional regulator [Candidatus Schekmanbacteria bacterium]
MTENEVEGAYSIGVVSDMLGIHPQTLRLYERRGLVKPSRSEGNTRLYSDEDLSLLRFILRLTQDLGVNLAGVEVIMQMRGQIMQLRDERDHVIRYLLTLLEEQARDQPPTSLIPVDVRKLVMKAARRGSSP